LKFDAEAFETRTRILQCTHGNTNLD
jgi:hypothetical protein